MTLTEAQTALAAVEAALLALAAGVQSYSIGDRSVTRSDESSLRNQAAYYQRIIRALTDQAAGATAPGFAIARWG